ncbi:MAG: GNAT family N-acetyltransferase [Clostridia bacterium]|nr:GNAT family N-acetyltransferase [Clostridia bacterium]
MNINIRRCMISDTHPIYELCHAELGYDFPEAQVESNIRRMMGEANNLLLVAEARGEVVGFIHAHNHEPVYAPPMKSVVALAIKPEFRKQGLGHMLVASVEDWARETGAAGVRVNSNENMNDGLRFYKSMGFEYIKTQYNFRKMLKKD